MINGKEFVEALTPQSALENLFDLGDDDEDGGNKDGQCDFLFKPAELRKRFKNALLDNAHESQSQKSYNAKTANTTAGKK